MLLACFDELRSIKIVEAMVFICKKLNKKIIAEGVEKIDDLMVLRKFGIDYAQVFLISQPQTDIRKLKSHYKLPSV